MMPIFMIGTQRSGSNLLRLMLNQLPEIAAPHPPHILQRMMPLLANYGDLSDDENFSLLVDDVCRLVELNPVPWEGVVLDRKEHPPAVQGAERTGPSWGGVRCLVSAEYGSTLSFLMPSADAELIENELIEKWGFAGYDGAVSLLMSRKTLKVQKAEIILKKWFDENNEDTFRDRISILNQHIYYLKIRLRFEINDVILSAKLKASSELISGIMEEHKDILFVKYKQLTYQDDFGNIILKDFHKELASFCKNVLAKKYEFYNIITEYAHEILSRKYLQHAENNFFGTHKNE